MAMRKIIFSHYIIYYYDYAANKNNYYYDYAANKIIIINK